MQSVERYLPDEDTSKRCKDCDLGQRMGARTRPGKRPLTDSSARKLAAPTSYQTPRLSSHGVQSAEFLQRRGGRGVGDPVCDGEALCDFLLSMFELLSVWLIKRRVLL